MDQLSNHSYHYKHYEGMVDDGDDDSESRKKSRRRKRMLTGVSKQRRAANERERKRLQIINKAYKELKGALPLFPNEDNIPKIKIVQLATRTIRYLSDILNNENPNEHMNNMDHLMDHHRSGGESSDMSESSPDGSVNNMEDMVPYIKQETYGRCTDLSNLFLQNEDMRLEFDSTFPSLDIDDTALTSDGFRGLDLSFFMGGNSGHSL